MSLIRFFFVTIVGILFIAASNAETVQVPVDDFIVREAEAFEASLQTTCPLKGKDARGWRADAEKESISGDHRTAAGYYICSVLSDKRNGEGWLKLAIEYLAIESDNEREIASFAAKAGDAAYIAYARSSDLETKARALAVLAQSLGLRDRWRSALRLYKASLALVPDAEVQKRYEDAFNEHGFRMLDYTVDNESSAPRVCVQFSEKLAKGVADYANFVTLNDEKPASVRVTGSQLCVEDLLHGNRYALKIRSGIPSIEGDLIAKSIEIAVYIRDRSPSVRFSSRNYVLPRTGQQGLPIVSINTKLVKADIYRIGDRRLADEVLDGNFQSQLDPYQLKQIADQKGEKLWWGEMPVSSKLNEEVTTAFPIDTLLPNLKPGLYVIAARAADESEKRSKAAESAAEEDEYSTRATQWFVVSDLGLTAFSGADGIHVYARSLTGANPMAGVDIRLVARNNDILGEARTDATGSVAFDAGLSRGTGGLSPAIIVARGADNDYGFLDITKQAFDLSDRGVAGRIAPGPLDAMIFTERGVYRSGETVYVTALLRDGAANAVPATPLVLKLFRPDGVEDRRETLPDQGNGGRGWSIALPETAMTGSWRIAAFVDPKAPSLFEKTFLVEDYVPERLEMRLTATKPEIAAGSPGIVALSGRYLYGAPASNLGLEGEVSISAANEVAAFPGFHVGLEDEKFTTVRKDLEGLPSTDAAGEATLPIPLPDLPHTTRALNAEVTIRLREPSGRALAGRLAMKVNTGRSFVGVKPLFGGSVAEGVPAEFEVVGIGPDGRQAALAGLKWEVQRVDRRFQWYFRDGRWSFEPITYENRVAGGVVDTPASGTVAIRVPVEPGTYRLDIASASAEGPATSLSFSAGWYVSEDSDTPEILDLALDRESYRPGDDLKVHIRPRMAGQALVAVVSDRVLATQLIAVDSSGGAASFKVDASWGPGAYAAAILYRPLDSAAKRMPSRAVGVRWVPLDLRPRTLSIALETEPTVRPGGPATVTASVSGLDKGETATLAISGVDVGILNITRYKTPAPENYFFGQRRLGLEMRDLYGKLIDGMQGVRGAVRSGGDEAGFAMSGRPLAETPLAVYSGPLQADANGRVQAVFQLPPFNGTMRLAAQAWSGAKLGHAEKDVIVRDAVVVQATPPKFLMLGDKSQVYLSLENVEAPAGTFKLYTRTDGGLEARGASERTLTLDANTRVGVAIPIAATAIGESHIAYTLTGPGNIALERTFAIPVEPPAPNVQRQTNLEIAAATGSLRIDGELIRDLIPATAKISVTASRTASFDVPGLLLALDRYPFGCAEQTTSRALPLLYYDEVAAIAHIGKEPRAKPAIEKAIARLYGMQSAAGAFGLWGPSNEDLWLTAYVTDFLSRAKEKGFAVRGSVYETALDRLKNTVNNAGDFKSGGETLAYSLYVLARAGRNVLGDLRYYADTKIEAFSTPMARAQIGAGLAMLGDRERAVLAFNSALALLDGPTPRAMLAVRGDYGTQLRDAAAVLALMGDGGAAPPQLQKAFRKVVALRRQQGETTTQEDLWLLLAARTLEAQNRDLALEVNGVPVKGSFQTVLSGSDFKAPSVRVVNVSALMPNAASPKFETDLSGEQLAKNGLVIRNTGQEAVPASILVTGEGFDPEPPAESGFKIERRTYAPDGREIGFEKFKQNDRVVVVLKVTEIEPRVGQIVVEDRLPAGFDIENPALLKAADLKAFSWLPAGYEPVFTAFRDDRFVAAYTLADAGRKLPAQLVMAYVMRAVGPGVYTHAGAYVDDMYRPGRFARTGGRRVEIVAQP